MSGIFRKPFKKVLNSGYGVPDLWERVEIVEEDSKDCDTPNQVVKVVRSESSALEKDMPERKEYDLETMLRCGYNPQPINVSGVLESDYSEQQAIEDFERLHVETLKSEKAAVEIPSVVEPSNND